MSLLKYIKYGYSNCKCLMKYRYVTRHRRISPISFVVTAAFIANVNDADDGDVHEHDGAMCSSNDIGWRNFKNVGDSNKRSKLLKQRIDCKSKKTLDTEQELSKYLNVLHSDWKVFKDENDNNKCHLIREFNVETFGEIMDICNTIFEIADNSNYHPDIKTFGHKKVIIDIYSYKSNNLRVNDFVFAARLDENIEKLMQQYLDDEF